MIALRWRLIEPPLSVRFRVLDAGLSLRWRGPDGTVAALAAAAMLAPVPAVALPSAIAAIVGPPGSGGGGGGEASVSAVADVAVPAGMPMAVSRANGHLLKADAASKPLAFVAGLAVAPTSIGFVGECDRGAVTIADWTAIAGTSALATGQPYFLAVGGGITLTPPAAPNCIAVIGTAISPTTLVVEPQSPIQL